MNHILIAEDEHLIARLVEMTLTRAGYRCTVAEDGRTAADLIEKTDFDMAILDIMLPGLDGYELLASLKPQGVPVIFLTAKSAVKDRVLGLRLGADDYITKPFGTEELLARIRAVLRSHRHSEEEESSPGGKFHLQDLLIDYDTRQVFVGKEEIDLTQTEYNIMAFLSVHAGKVLTYAAIIRAVWGYSDYGSVKKLQVNMKNIRKKMGVTPGEKRYIINELGVGYRMLAEDEIVADSFL